MEKYTLYLGLNDKDTKQQQIETIEAYKLCSGLLADTIGAGTISAAQGIYKHENGAVVIENTLRIEIIEAAADLVMQLCGTLKKLFNQESILVQRDSISNMFV